MVATEVVLICAFFGSADSFLRIRFDNVGPTVAFSNGTALNLTAVAKHEDMTKNALLSVAANILISTVSSRTSAGLRELNVLNESSLIAAYCGTPEQTLVDSLKDAINTVSRANADVDIDVAEFHRAAAHFHSEQFQAGQNRLVEIRIRLVQQITSSNFVQARQECGRLLHGVQDFYSHTNWIENRNMDPYDVLGIPDQNPDNIADQQMRTCINCDRRGGNIYKLNFAGGDDFYPLELYSCRGNLNSDLEQSRILTSGYYGGTHDENRQAITKPIVKCSHGAPFDRTHNMEAVGGINKDTPFEILSPHYFLHEQAVRMAERASVDILQGIRREVNDDSKFGQFLGLPTNQDSAQVSSIAYVIDTTGSMGEELPEIQATIPVIRETLRNFTTGLECGTRARYILVPFNDPDPGILITTVIIEEFLGNISHLRADGGGDAPEPSIGAIIRAVQASEPNSPIYVFTDAAASDGNRKNELQTLLGIKNTPIFFALVDINRRKRSADAGIGMRKRSRVRRTSASDLSLYEDLASISGGQVLNVQTSDISELATQISFSAFQNPHTVFHKSGRTTSSSQVMTYQVPLDSSVQRAVITISGTSISNVAISSPQGTDAGNLEAFMMRSASNSNSRYVGEIFLNSLQYYGNWTVSFQSASFSLDVTAARRVYIQETVYQVDHFNAYGFSIFEGMPLEGQELIVQIEVDSSVTTVRVTHVHLVDGSGNLLSTLNDAVPIGRGRFAVLFRSPNVPFLFRIEGEDGNGYAFSHVTNLPIKVSRIRLSLGEGVSKTATIRPNETVKFTIELHNEAPFNRFLLTANPLISSLESPTTNISEFMEYSLMPSSTSLSTNSSTSVYLAVAAINVDQSMSVRFTVFAEAEGNREINNYIELNVFATNIPPGNVTKNIEYTAVTTPGSSAMLSMSYINSLVYFVISVMIVIDNDQ